MLDEVSYIRLEKYGRPWHDWFVYDETSPSCLRWKTDRRRGRGEGYVFIHAGDVAGTLTVKGYWVVEVDYDTAMVHRVIWEMHHRPLEENEVVDHDDGDKGHNVVSNLLVKSHTGNARNHKMPSTNKTGVCGVHFRDNEFGGRYVASWRGLNKKEVTRSFAVSTYGSAGAFQLACDLRAKMIAELKQLGAEYTDRHGSKEGA